MIGQLSLLLVPANMVLSKINNHEHRTKETYESYTFQPLMSFWKNPMNPFGLLNMEYYCDERQAPVARGVHLVIFSKSFQWNSIHLLFRTFRQEISVTVVKVSRVVLEVNSVWSCERLVHVGIYATSVRYLLVMLIMQVIKYRLPSFSQPESLIAGLPRATEPHTHRIWSTSFRLVVTWLTERSYVRTYVCTRLQIVRVE